MSETAKAAGERTGFLRRPGLTVPSLHPQTLAFAGALLVLVIALFRDAVLRGRVFFHRDVHLMWYTQVETFVRAVAAGEWPVWNPYIGFGQPLLADANTQLLYPPTWLNLVVRPWTYYTAYVVAHLVAGGVGLFVLARRLGTTRAGAAVAALLWVACGPVLSVVEMWNQLAGAAWMPWAGVAALSALSTGRAGWAVAWGAAQAAQVLAGSVEAAVMTAAGVAGYAAFMRPWADARVGRRRLLVLTALALITALGLSAGQWLPSLAVAARSARADLPAETRAYWSVHPAGMLQMWLPVRLSALHLAPAIRRALFEGREPLFASLYVGLPSVALVGAALAGRRRVAALLLCGFLLAVVVALGRHTPLFAALTALPPLRALRYPVKATLAAALCWSLLSGLGFDTWAGGERLGRRRWAAFVVLPLALATSVCGALAVALAGWPERFVPAFLATPEPGLPLRELLLDTVPSLGIAASMGVIGLLAAWRRQGSPSPARVAAIVAAATILPMAAWHDRISPTAPRDLYTVRPPVLAPLRPDRARVYVYDYNVEGKSRRYLGRDFPYEIVRGLPGWPYPATVALAQRLAVFPPVAGAWGIPGSFDRDTPGLAPRSLGELCDALLLVEGTAAHLRLLQMGAVVHVVALHTEGLQSLRPVATADALMSEPVRVFEVPAPMPRAYAVSGVRVADGHEALRVFFDPQFDPAAEVVLASGLPAPVDPRFRGTAAITRLGADRLAIDVELSAPGHVVMADAYDPGWRAWVDGQERPVLRANLALRAVALPAGRHSLELRYRPPTLVSVLVLGLAGAAAATRGRREGTP
jgi:Bacterial membrane protein YfhO